MTVADDVSWQGHRSEGWLCRHVLPWASTHSFQCGRSRELVRSYPIAHVGVFVNKELVLSGS